MLTFRTLFLLILLALLAACAPRLSSRFARPTDFETLPESYDAAPVNKQKNSCDDYAAYIPDTSHLDHTPIKYVRVNIHWVNTSDSTGNFFGNEAIEYTKGLLHAANYNLEGNKKMWLPNGNDTPLLPIRYRLVLTPDPNIPNDQGIYFHFDDEVCYYIHRGRNANLGDRRVAQRYGVQLDSVMNIFIMPHHPDSVASKTYHAGMVGVFLGNATKLAGPFENLQSTPWDLRGTLNHEIAHAYGLSHAWLDDGCDDTPRHNRECWNKTDRPECDTLTSNNIMDYSFAQHAWSPCQIGKIHQRMSQESSRPRKYLQPNWCELHEDRHIVIRDTIVWRGAKDLEGHLTIARGGQLTIQCRVSLPKGAKITLQPGATLVLGDGARLHNACGDEWQGIEIQSLKEQSGRIVKIGNPKVEDVMERGEGGK